MVLVSEQRFGPVAQEQRRCVRWHCIRLFFGAQHIVAPHRGRHCRQQSARAVPNARSRRWQWYRCGISIEGPRLRTLSLARQSLWVGPGTRSSTRPTQPTRECWLDWHSLGFGLL
ncbi:hypothetical protein H257_10246 [Aphanomyces astaci]|uniref:Uncharacterized protein n=1 Tax=Aphanomyces astaci TaxID=112090 RepID=W4G6U5_APHAT|nr:hypothetical protein H257_10246 [Aphanomyces astaci]ETV75395.1 hypothetical protein H257_10246 [Aphanomyces astaci]|eukprot:XP_009835029.1 hypothetical protein H257_10246 [Aphanomyces astaci]